MKKSLFKMLSKSWAMVMLVTLFSVAIFQVSIFAAAGNVFQENFESTSNNGYLWGSADVIIKNASITGPINGWIADGNTVTRKAAGTLRITDGSTSTTKVYHSFANVAGGDVTVKGSISMSDSRVISVIVYNGTQKVAQLSYKAVGTTPTYFDGTTERTFSANATRVSGVWNPFEIILRWDGSKFASADYYIGQANIDSNTNATLAAGYTGSLIDATQTQANKFAFGEGTQTGVGANLDFDNLTVYAANGVTLPTASAVTVSGSPKVGEILTGAYTYSGTSTELNSTYQWMQSDTVDGTYNPISGANSTSFTLTSAQLGYYIKYQVTPNDNSGNTGAPTLSYATALVSNAASSGTLATPAAPTVSGSTFSWSAIPNASSYTLVLTKDGSVINTYSGITGLSQDISADVNANGSGVYSATVQAIGDGINFTNSAVSNSTPLSTTLATPNSPSWISGSTFGWTAVPNAPSYTLVLTKGTTTINTYTGITVTSYDFASDIAANGAGTYSVTVQAVGDGIYYYSSAATTAVSKTWYSVTYDPNTGTGSVPVDTKGYTTGSHFAVMGNVGTPPLTRTGYTFTGWAKAAGTDGVGSGTTYKVGDQVALSTANITLYATWVISSYAVTFNSQGGSSVLGVNANYNTKITAPTAPTWAAHNFVGWYKEPSCINAWNFSTDVITSDTTLYASWVENISFTSDLIIKIPVKSNDTVSVNIQNVTSSNITGTIVIGSYSGPKMNDALVQTITIIPGVNNYDIDVSQFSKYAGSNIKVFILNNLDTIKPFCPKTEF